jgi:hypothetical protein
MNQDSSLSEEPCLSCAYEPGAGSCNFVPDEQKVKEMKELYTDD